VAAWFRFSTFPALSPSLINNLPTGMARRQRSRAPPCARASSGPARRRPRRPCRPASFARWPQEKKQPADSRPAGLCPPGHEGRT
jgi:hypothetical protein